MNAATINPVPLSKLRSWATGKKCHPATRGEDMSWDAHAVLRNFGIPFLYLEYPEPLPIEPEKRIEKEVNGRDIFQQENNSFTFLDWANQRFLVAEHLGGATTLVLAGFIDFSS